MNIVILAAIRREIDGIVRLCRARRATRRPYRSFYASYLSHDVTMVETGMGSAAAARAAESTLEVLRPDLIVSCGYAGALTGDLRVGDVVLASAVHFTADGLNEIAIPDLPGLQTLPQMRPATVVTMDVWKKKWELLRLMPGIPAPCACDMETYAVARVCLQRAVPFLALRAVSDAAGEEVPFDPSSLCSEAGEYLPARSLHFFLTHPRLLFTLPKLRRDSALATRSLTRAIDHLLHLL